MKLRRILTIFIILVVTIINITSICYAKVDTSEFKPSELNPSDYKKVTTVSGPIIGVIVAVGIIVAVGGAMILGVKYMLGSVEQKAEYKKTMIPYLIGCVMILFTTQIIKFVYDVVVSTNINNM